MTSQFQKTKEALKNFQNGIACARCEKSQNDLQFLGTSCKHAFCWNCVSEMTTESNKKRNISILCPRCAMPLNMNKTTGASILNNCFSLLTDLDKLIKEFDSNKMTMTEQEISCTQRIFDDFEVNENNGNVRTVDEFLMTQPADLDDSSDERLSSASPELDDISFTAKAYEKQKEEEKIKQAREKEMEEVKPVRRSSLKRAPPAFEDESKSAKRSSSTGQKLPAFNMNLFDSQVPTKVHDGATLTPFVNRRSTVPTSATSGMVSMFSEPLRTSRQTTPVTDDVFTKKVVNTRRTVSAATAVVKKEEVAEEEEKTPRIVRPRKSNVVPNFKKVKNEKMSTRSSSIPAEDLPTTSDNYKAQNSRSNSPASILEKSSARLEPRRSSLGTRRGEVVIINSILNFRIPQLKSAIEAGTCVNEKENGKTPLFVAVEVGNLEAAKILVDAGALINANCLTTYETVLHEAVKRGDLQMVEFLLAKGASIKSKNSWQKTPEDLMDKNDWKMKKVFDRYRNRHLLQPVIPPRRPVILFVQLVDEKVISEAEKQKLPGKINLVSSEMEGITHVVVEIDTKTKVLTILKDQLATILKAIIKPGMIVSSQWLKACMEDEKNVDEDRNYMVHKLRWMDGDIVDGSFEGWKKTDNRMNPKLFAGCKFFFLRAKYTFLDRPTLVEIVRAGGGQVTPREPLYDEKDPPPYHNSELKPNFVVYSLNHEVPDKYRDRGRFTLVCEQWLIDAILWFSISSSPY